MLYERSEVARPKATDRGVEDKRDDALRLLAEGTH
jgi:hypothetical protein